MKSFEKILINPEATIREALKIIDGGGKRIALVTNKELQLLGTITDGDIRRALLGGIRLDDLIEGVFNPQPLTCHLNESRSQILRKASTHKIFILPVVDENNRLVGIEDINEFLEPKPMNNLVVLMAGGMGNRLKPLTEDVPKPMLKLGDKHILETIIDNFIQHGFSNFAISVNYKSQMIRDHFGDGKKHGIRIDYLKEREKMGTAGSLSMLRKIPDLPFFVMNGDILTNINLEQFLEFHKLNNADATVAVSEISFEIPYGVVRMKEKQILDIREKPSQVFFVNAGIYVMEPRSLKYITGSGYMDMPQLLKKMIDDGRKVISFPIHEYWLDIGKMDDYKKAQSDFNSIFNGDGIK
jgi:dTDP-glucose pyrophosphorylase